MEQSIKKYTEFSLRLKKSREAAGLSKAALARKVEVSSAYIGQLEGMTNETLKRPSKLFIDKVSSILKVNSVWLETGEERTQIDKYLEDTTPRENVSDIDTEYKEEMDRRLCAQKIIEGALQYLALEDAEELAREVIIKAAKNMGRKATP